MHVLAATVAHTPQHRRHRLLWITHVASRCCPRRILRHQLQIAIPFLPDFYWLLVSRDFRADARIQCTYVHVNLTGKGQHITRWLGSVVLYHRINPSWNPAQKNSGDDTVSDRNSAAALCVICLLFAAFNLCQNVSIKNTFVRLLCTLLRLGEFQCAQQSIERTLHCVIWLGFGLALGNGNYAWNLMYNHSIPRVYSMRGGDCYIGLATSRGR